MSSLLRDSTHSAVSSLFNTGSRLLITIMLARSLAPEVYGQYVFLQWVIDLFNCLCSFGLPGIMTRFLPAIAANPHDQGMPPKRILLGLVAGSVSLSALLFLGYLFIAQQSNTADLWVLLAWCIASTSVSFFYSGLQGLFRYDAVMAGNLAFAASGPLLVVYLVHTPSVTHAALAMTLALVASACVAFTACRVIPSRAHKVSSRNMPNRRTFLTYGLNLWITGLLGALVWSRGEFGILKVYVENDDIAIYSAALSLCGAITQATGLLTGALTPHLAMHWTSGNTDRIGTILRRVTQATMMCACTIALILIGFGTIIINLLFGSAYVGSYEVLCILAIAAISISCGCANTMLQIETDARFDRNSNLVGLVLLMIVSIALTPYMGIVGAAIARALAQITIAIYTFLRLARVDSLDETARRLMKTFLFSIAAVAMYYFIIKIYKNNIIASAVLTLLYIAGLLMAIRLIIGEKIGFFSTAARFFRK